MFDKFLKNRIGVIEKESKKGLYFKAINELNRLELAEEKSLKKEEKAVIKLTRSVRNVEIQEHLLHDLLVAAQTRMTTSHQNREDVNTIIAEEYERVRPYIQQLKKDFNKMIAAAKHVASIAEELEK